MAGTELVSTRLLQNETPIPGSGVVPTSAQQVFDNMLIADLTAGDTLALQLYGADVTVALQPGTGASLTAVRLA